MRPVGAVDREAGQCAHHQRHAQGPGRRGAGRALPPGSVLPAQRDPDPRAATARAPRRPAADLRRIARAHRARRRRRCRPPTLSRRCAAAAVALPVPGQRARAGEPAAPRASPCRAATSSSATTWAWPTTRSSTTDRADARRADRRRRVAAIATDAEADLPTDLAGHLDDVERDILSARSSVTASTAPPPAPVWACRCARCATGWRGWASTSHGADDGADRLCDGALSAGRAGLVAPTRARCPSPNLRRRARRGCRSRWWWCTRSACRRASMAATRSSSLFTNRLDCDAHPYFDAPARPAGVGALPRSPRRRVAAVRLLRPTRLACGRVRCGAAGDNCNDYSIGIELEGLEGERFEPAQYAALAALLRALARRYPMREVVGHEHVAPGRKADPGAGFDWRAAGRANCGRATVRGCAGAVAPSGKVRMRTLAVVA